MTKPEQAKSNRTVTVEHLTVEKIVDIRDQMINESVEVDGLHLHGPSIKHYNQNPNMYVERVEPEKLNWGKWMDADKLKQQGFKANRVSVPGDWDYKKVI